MVLMNNTPLGSRRYTRLSIVHFARAGAFFLSIFTVMAYWRGDTALGHVLAFYAVMVSGFSIYVERGGKLLLAQWWAGASIVSFYFYLLLTGAYHGTGYLWCFVFYPIPYFIFGARIGAMVNALMIGGAAVSLLWPDAAWLVVDYPMDIRTRFLAGSVALTFLTYIHASDREAAEHEILRLTARVQKLARTDELTQLLNRRAAKEYFVQKLSEIKRYGGQFGLMILDIDNFKRINDTFGHDVGDRVLMEIAAILRRSMRSSDLVARWGGEEIVIMMPSADSSTVRETAEKIRKIIASQPMQVCSEPLSISVSIGATVVTASDTQESALKRADDALYEAKRSGKNRVIVRMSEETLA